MPFRIPLIDLFAAGWFLALWAGYAQFSSRRAGRVPSLMGTVHGYRRQWMANVVDRDNRMVDAAILTSLSNSSTFFASTTMLILGGLLAALGTTEKVVEVVEELPFTAKASELVWEMKILLLLGIFVYAFFKFTWSLRQFNFCAILVGAAPPLGADPQMRERYVVSAAHIASLAGDTFNNGLRAYYFSLAALTWFLNPWVLIVASAGVVAILYWREFRSQALKALAMR